MNPRFIPVAVAVGLALCGAAAACAGPPLVEAPGADAVAAGRTADAVALAATLRNAGLVDDKTGLAAAVLAAAPALDAGAPFIASHLSSGAVIVATRLGAGASSSSLAAAEQKPVIGKTSSVALGSDRALVRVDRDRVLVAVGVPAGDEPTIGAVMELMASQSSSSNRAITPGTIELHVKGSALPIATGDVDATIRVDAKTLAIEARAEHPNEALLASFRSTAPPWACSLGDGAAALVAIPPVVVGEDSFQGRLVVALYAGDEKGPAFAVAGVPRDHAAAQSLVASVKEAAGKSVTDGLDPGGTVLLDAVDADLHARVRDDAFVLTRGKAPAGSRPNGGASVAATDSACGARLLTVRGAELARVLLPVLATPADLLRALIAGGGGNEERPFAKLVAVQQLDVDAAPDGAALVLSARLVLNGGAS